MKHSAKKKSILQHFTALYFAMLLVSALVIGTLVVSAAADSIRELETHSMQAALDLLAVDMEAQTDAMERAAQSILINNLYRRSVLNTNKYNEVEMLRHFSNFAQATALSDAAMLVYEGENMAYKTDGYKTDFLRFCQSKYALYASEAKKLYEQIMECSENTLYQLSAYGGTDMVFFVYPICFPGTVSHSEAKLIFVVSTRRIKQRMQALSAYSFDDYALLYGDMALLSADNENATNMMSQTQNGQFWIAVAGNPDAFRQALRSNLAYIISLVLGVIVLFAFFSFLLAKNTSKPIRDLAARYGIGMHEYNEYLRLENAFLTLEQENKEALFTARQQLLRMLLNGDCAERALAHGANFGVAFPYEFNSAFVMTIANWQEDKVKDLGTDIEAFSEADAIFYAVPRQEDNCVAILVCFRYEYLYSEIAELLAALTNGTDTALYCGTVCENALNLPISYSHACNAAGLGEKIQEEQSRHERAAYFLQQAQNAFHIRDRRAYDAAMDGLGKLIAENGDDSWLKSHVYQNMLVCMEHDHVISQKMDMKTFANLLEIENFNDFTRQLFALGETSVCSTQQEQANVVHSMILFMYKNVFHCDFSLGALADEFSLSTDYISRLIKAETGRSFKEYVVELRMNEAKGLLVHRPEWTITDIATACGYRSPSNFIKQFRDYTGSTPLQYRRENGDEP